MTSTLSYNKEQLLNYYRATCPDIQEPPENLKQFPLILSTKLLQPVNETNLHLFDSDYNINPDVTFPALSTRGRGRGGRGGSRRGGGLIGSGRGSSISPLVTSPLGNPSGTSSLFGTSPTTLGRAGTPIGSGPRSIARSPLSLGGSRLPAWAMDEDLTQTDSSLSGLNNSNSLLSNNTSSSFFGNSTSNSSLDDDTFGPSSLQPQSSPYQPMVSLESLAAATMKMNETWKNQMNKKPLDDFDDSLEPQGMSNDGGIGTIDWDSQWYYLSEDNEPKGPYNLQKLKEWMDLFYLQSDTRIKQDVESSATTTLGEVLNTLALRNSSHINHGMVNNILTSQNLLSNKNTMKSNLHSNDFFMNDKSSIPTGSGILGSVLNDPFMSSQSLVKSPLQGSLLSSLDKPQQTPITPTQQFAHPWAFGQQPMEPMVHPGYPFVNHPNMPNHFMPPFHQGPGHWGNMPNLMNLGASNNNNSNSIPSVTDIENELLYVPQQIPSHQEVFQHYTPVQPVSMQEQVVVEEDEEPIVDEDLIEQHTVETPIEEETSQLKEEVVTQESKVDDKTSKKEKNKKKGAETKPVSSTPSKKKQELPPVKEEPVFKSVPPTETVSFADPKKEEVKGWGVQPAVTTAPVQTLKQIMEQQKKEALKQSKETQQKKKEAEQVIKVNTANPWGVANATTVSGLPSLKEIQEEEAKKKKQKAQKQQQSQNQASIVKNATSSWGGSALQFKAIPEKDVPSTSVPQFGASTPTKTVETKSFQFQAIKPQTLPAGTSSTSPKEEEDDQEEGGFWDYSPTPATATVTPVITTASEKKTNKKDKKKKATTDKPATTNQTTTTTTSTNNTAVEDDFPSISTKNNPFGQSDVSQEFKDWFKKGLKKLNKSVDPSFMYFLLSLNSEKETIDYMSEYIGNSSAAQKFAQEFIANKSFEMPNQGANKKKK